MANETGKASIRRRTLIGERRSKWSPPLCFNDLVERSIPIPECGCLVWLGHVFNNKKSPDLYGTMCYKSKPESTHRLAWMFTRGEIPKGMVIDHLCRVTLCINPDHLDLVTPGENIRRGKQSALKIRPTHCKNGHEFTPGNTRLESGGYRKCKTCVRLRRISYQQVGRRMGGLFR